MVNLKDYKKALMLFLVLVSGLFFLLGCLTGGPQPVKMQNLTVEEQSEYTNLEAHESILQETLDAINRNLAVQSRKLYDTSDEKETWYGRKYRSKDDQAKRDKLIEENNRLYEEKNDVERQLIATQDRLKELREKSNEPQRDGNDDGGDGGHGGDGGQG